ncbi:SpoIIIAH-like family protein [Sporolactobacillus vineae]|uniref:SpoIIIAH-like family protein n=1 Tax=Sporolactobacillus vineae TaxID=444463 RepID=UPI0002898DE3|nr:SpoIIIAH-like family protein [Sporolactobacillus vineae]
MVKKQTVWLLTMLSLIVVLSVYALNAPDKPSGSTSGSSQGAHQAVSGKNSASVKVTSSENKLGQIELDKASARAQQQKQYESVIASSKSSAKEASAAYDKMQAMKTAASNETMLEDAIQSKGYKNAVVRDNGSDVQIYVDARQLTDQQANSLIRLANQYLGAGHVVSVGYNLGAK